MCVGAVVSMAHIGASVPRANTASIWSRVGAGVGGTVTLMTGGGGGGDPWA